MFSIERTNSLSDRDDQTQLNVQSMDSFNPIGSVENSLTAPLEEKRPVNHRVSEKITVVDY